MNRHTTSIALVVACGLLAACNDAAPAPASPAPTADAHDHSSLAKHGGALVEVGSHDAMLEVAHDEATGVVVVYVMDMDGEALAPTAAPVLNLMVDGAPKQIEGTGSAGEWTFSDEALKGHVDDGRIRLEVNGKTFTTDLPHAH